MTARDFQQGVTYAADAKLKGFIFTFGPIFFQSENFSATSGI
jgi:hypothetical protein